MEFIVESLKKLTKDELEEKPKTLIVISTVMTWANSEVIKI